VVESLTLVRHRVGAAGSSAGRPDAAAVDRQIQVILEGGHALKVLPISPGMLRGDRGFRLVDRSALARPGPADNSRPPGTAR
jgi:hypothetical protein